MPGVFGVLPHGARETWRFRPPLVRAASRSLPSRGPECSWRGRLVRRVGWVPALFGSCRASLQSAKSLGANVIGTRARMPISTGGRPLSMGPCTLAPISRRGDAGYRGKGVNSRDTWRHRLRPMIRSMAFEDGSPPWATSTNAHVRDRIQACLNASSYSASPPICAAREQAPRACRASLRLMPAIARPHPSPARSVFPFAELPAAKAHMESDQHAGKIVLAMP